MSEDLSTDGPIMLDQGGTCEVCGKGASNEHGLVFNFGGSDGKSHYRHKGCQAPNDVLAQPMASVKQADFGMDFETQEPWTCPVCGHVNPGGAKRCSICGSPNPNDLAPLNASRTAMTYRECATCNASGQCQSCNGRRCIACKGTGNCQDCAGLGETPLLAGIGNYRVRMKRRRPTQ